MKMPEEINRILTDRISDLLFCPTDNAVRNLQKEGFGEFKCEVHQVGDVMYDAALFYGARSSQRSDIISRLNLSDRDFVLSTVHRQENTDNIDKLNNIVSALNEINNNMPVVLPLHPRTRKILDMHAITTGFEPIEPVGYFEIIELLKHCRMVVTDSGGMQKEAYFFRKYCLTLRDETEWVELTEYGFNQLCGADKGTILSGYHHFRNKPFSGIKSLYGEGNAASIIAGILSNA